MSDTDFKDFPTSDPLWLCQNAFFLLLLYVVLLLEKKPHGVGPSYSYYPDGKQGQVEIGGREACDVTCPRLCSESEAEVELQPRGPKAKAYGTHCLLASLECGICCSSCSGPDSLLGGACLLSSSSGQSRK